MIGDITPEMVEAIPEAERGPWLEVLERQERRKRLIAERANAGDWGEALMLCDSPERAPLLVRAMQTLDGDALRELIADWWSTTEAWSGNPELREGMMDGLRKAAPVIVPSDDPGRHQTPPDGRFTVYRGNLGETPQGGSWSLDKDTAISFARLATGPRGQIVFGYPADGTGTVWSADCDAADVLGFFDDRQEYEIVTDRVSNVEKVGELVKARVEEAS
jgi:hypothetical protein